MESWREIETRAEALHPGSGDDRRSDAGVLHGTAAWASPNGPLLCLRIDAHTPASPTDFFALSLARARADAIVTTGATLRAEPELRHEAGTGALARGLADWRSRVAERTAPPVSVVLTRSGELDADHALLADPARRVWIATGEDGARALAPRRLPAHVEVWTLAQPSLRAVVAGLRSERGLGTVVVEAGPSAARELYTPPVAVDELWLSLCGVEPAPDVVEHAPLPSLTELEHRLGPPRSGVDGDEPSGPWSFRRYRAARRAAPPSC
ncbi:MAG: dihydrofolate reductase family protein [Proteobacteria bacterium]|nr:dihydrofolate reductase family protein [Pseudomonadota bacterium]